MRDWKHRKEQAAPTWFKTPDGIRGHFAAEREAEAANHAARMKRINDDENAMLDALRKMEEQQQ